LAHLLKDLYRKSFPYLRRFFPAPSSSQIT